MKNRYGLHEFVNIGNSGKQIRLIAVNETMGAGFIFRDTIMRTKDIVAYCKKHRLWDDILSLIEVLDLAVNREARKLIFARIRELEYD